MIEDFDAIIAKKHEGNIMFSKGLFKEACIIYGEAIEDILLFETKYIESNNQDVLTFDFQILKPTVFLNLAGI